MLTFVPLLKTIIMESQKRKIEVFTSGCLLCEPVVKMVKETACPSCEVIVYNLAEPCESNVCLNKVATYDIKTLPAVVVDGTLLSCCQNSGVTLPSLRDSGVGQAVN